MWNVKCCWLSCCLITCHIVSQVGVAATIIVFLARENARHATRERYDSSHIWEAFLILIGAALFVWILLLLIELVASIFFLLGIKQANTGKCKAFFITTLVILVLELIEYIIVACAANGSVEFYEAYLAFGFYILVHHVIMSVISWRCMRKIRAMNVDKVEPDFLQHLQPSGPTDADL